MYRFYRVYTGFFAARSASRNDLPDAGFFVISGVVTAASGAAVTITSATLYDDI